MEPQFQFPFEPYEIQKKFMRELYDTIDKGELGIFESPTGTGKSLSICCGALQWLKDHNQKVLSDLENEIASLKAQSAEIPDADDWLQEEYHKIKINQTIAKLQLRLDKLKNREEYFVNLKKRVALCKSNTNKIDHYFKKQPKDIEEGKENRKEKEEENGEDDLVIEEMDENTEESDTEDIHDDDENEPITKIYISSRTHSQLSQFIGEIKRTVFNNNVRVVTLASRQHYCINADVNKLKSVHLINERCIDLQKSKTKSTLTGDDGKVIKKTKTKSCSGCPYYNQTNITKLKERMLVDIMDMEDLVKCGKVLKACPYYASRMALEESEVVLLSHAAVASGGARAGLALRLRGAALVLDEAHALAAALEAAHAAPAAAAPLRALHAYLRHYIGRYRPRLSSRNLLNLNQMHYVVGKLLGMLQSESKDETEEAKVYTIEDFVIKADIDHLNLRPLIEFCRQTRLAPKLHGFSMRYSQQDLEEMDKTKPVDKKKSFKDFLSNIAKKTEKEVVVEKKEEEKITIAQPSVSAGSALYAVLDLLEMVCGRSEAGRVVVRAGRGFDAGLKYLLLDPAAQFAEVVNQCRSVVVAGGTMEPMSEFRTLLGAEPKETEGDIKGGAGPPVSVGPRRALREVRCGHVVAARNVLAVALRAGPTGRPLVFTHESRDNAELEEESCAVVRGACAAARGGVVAFVASYAAERRLARRLPARLAGKPVFREPRAAADVPAVLQKYAAAVHDQSPGNTGALLISVVGGKLSEGINFSDDLGRCVIVLGLPYPNITSPELKEKMNYLNRQKPGAGAEYYENLCMKAVNQCIGFFVSSEGDGPISIPVSPRKYIAALLNALGSMAPIIQ